MVTQVRQVILHFADFTSNAIGTGQDGGQALADIIFGKVAPAGRLPASMYPGDYVNQVPMTDMALRPSNGSDNTTASPGRTYQWYPKTVYPFGYGIQPPHLFLLSAD